MSLRPLKDATGKWAPAAGTHGDPLVALAAAWPAIVGKDIAQHSRPLEINGDTLLVATRSSAWTQQLSFLGDHVLREIAEHVHIEGISKIRFRVGKLGASAARPHGTAAKRPARLADRTYSSAATLEEAIERFRTSINSAQRAKSAAGWKECQRCGVYIARRGLALCLPCELAESESKGRKVARLLFEAPWLGHAGISALVEDLTKTEYESIRLRVLAQWWERLVRAQRSGKLARGGRERLIASSYVILKSGLDPERISPAVVRNLLGDALHDFIYGIVNT